MFLKYAFFAVLALSANSTFAAQLEIPSDSYQMTLKVSALATCNFSEITSSIEETEKEIIVNFTVSEPGRVGCFDKNPVFANVPVSLNYGQLNSSKTLKFQSRNSSVKVIGVEFF